MPVLIKKFCLLTSQVHNFKKAFNKYSSYQTFRFTSTIQLQFNVNRLNTAQLLVCLLRIIQQSHKYLNHTIYQ